MKAGLTVGEEVACDQVLDDNARPTASGTWSGLARRAAELRTMFALMHADEEEEEDEDEDGGARKRDRLQEDAVVGS